MRTPSTLSAPPPTRLAATALKTLDRHAATLSTHERCKAGLATLADLESKGVAFALGPNVVNRVMRLCSEDACCTEALFERLVARDLHDASSIEILASSRLANNASLPTRPQLLLSSSRCSSKLASRCHGAHSPHAKLFLTRANELRSRRRRLHSQSGRDCASLASCRAAMAMAAAQTLHHHRSSARLLCSSRTLCMAATSLPSHASSAAEGFETVATRRWRMCETEASQFLSVSWGSNAGDRRRKFFRSMVEFYSSGECLALLLQREDAIGGWRQLLGPRGDPGACDPQSVRARFGTNRQANAAHGADSIAAATREIEFVFGHGWSEPHWAPIVPRTADGVSNGRAVLRRRGNQGARMGPAIARGPAVRASCDCAACGRALSVVASSTCGGSATGKSEPLAGARYDACRARARGRDFARPTVRHTRVRDDRHARRRLLPFHRPAAHIERARFVHYHDLTADDHHDGYGFRAPDFKPQEKAAPKKKAKQQQKAANALKTAKAAPKIETGSTTASSRRVDVDLARENWSSFCQSSRTHPEAAGVDLESLSQDKLVEEYGHLTGAGDIVWPAA